MRCRPSPHYLINSWLFYQLSCVLQIQERRGHFIHSCLIPGGVPTPHAEWTPLISRQIFFQSGLDKRQLTYTCISASDPITAFSFLPPFFSPFPPPFLPSFLSPKQILYFLAMLTDLCSVRLLSSFLGNLCRAVSLDAITALNIRVQQNAKEHPCILRKAQQLSPGTTGAWPTPTPKSEVLTPKLSDIPGDSMEQRRSLKSGRTWVLNHFPIV